MLGFSPNFLNQRRGQDLIRLCDRLKGWVSQTLLTGFHYTLVRLIRSWSHWAYGHCVLSVGGLMCLKCFEVFDVLGFLECAALLCAAGGCGLVGVIGRVIVGLL